MTTRRDFPQIAAGALADLAFVGCDLMAAAPAPGLKPLGIEG